MTIPEATITTDEVLRGVLDGKSYWAMRGTPQRNKKAEVFYASLVDELADEDDEAWVPMIDYVGGYWSDESGGEEDILDFEEAVEEFDLEGVLWHPTDRPFPAGMTTEATVAGLLA